MKWINIIFTQDIQIGTGGQYMKTVSTPVEFLEIIDIVGYDGFLHSWVEESQWVSSLLEMVSFTQKMFNQW